MNYMIIYMYNDNIVDRYRIIDVSMYTDICIRTT